MSAAQYVPFLVLAAASLLVACAGRAQSERDETLADYFVQSRDAPDVDERMTELTPAHWDYMDRFRLVARGPTLTRL